MEEKFDVQHEKFEGVRVLVEIHHDEDGYMVWEDYDHADIRTFWDKREFWNGVLAEGLSEDDVSAFVAGDVVIHNKKLYMGLERYEHSGSVYALCGEGHFPDRNWDVSPIVGWVSLDKDLHGDVVEPYLRQHADWVPGTPIALDDVKNRARSEVQVYNDAITGNCWGYTMNFMDGQEVVETDSCWGFLGDSDYCKDEAMGVAKRLLADYKPPVHKICPTCGQRIKGGV